MPAIVVSLIFLLVAAFSSVAETSFENASISREAWQKLAQQTVAEEVYQYFTETGTYPSNLAALVATPGYEHLRPFLSVSSPNGMHSSPARNLVDISTATLTDSFWQYSRVAVTSQKNKSVPLATYLAINSCPPGSGSTAFSTTTSWCGSKDSNWIKLESRQDIYPRITSARLSMNRTIGKIVENYNKTTSFPSVSTATTLRSLVTPGSGASVGTNSATCVGLFLWQNIPMGCEDLYSRFDTPVSYQALTSKRILLTADSNVINSSATNVSIAVEINLL